MQQTMLSTYALASGGQKVLRTETIGGYTITLMQHPRRKQHSFSVQYGKQLDHALTYSQAAMAYGAAVMHALACEGELDNERD